LILKNRISLITGSSRGIGRAIALNFAKEGSDVVVNYVVNDDAAEEVISKIRSIGCRCFSFKADVSKGDNVKKLFSKIIQEYGKIDILVNNAGITMDSTLHKMSYENWDSIIKVNLTGVFNCCRQAVVSMRENNYGRIINISSVVGLCGNFGQTNYAASKAGVIGFTKSLAYETAKRKITVNAVAPGFIETDMTKKIPDNIKEKIISSIPIGRFGDAEDIAKMVTFLVSDDASYITGQVFSVNGGYLM